MAEQQETTSSDGDPQVSPPAAVQFPTYHAGEVLTAAMLRNLEENNRNPEDIEELRYQRDLLRALPIEDRT